MADDLEKDTEDQSLRDALSAAFDGADETPAAEPEEQADEAPELDENGQPRDERGRWTKAQREHYEAQQREQQATQEQQAPEQASQELRLAPPPGWTPAAKAAYASLPPEVQEAVARREQEINNGFAKLRDYKGLDEYADMAKASGTTLREAFDRYKAAEDLLDRDFRGGVLSLCEMYGVHPMQLAQEFAGMFTSEQGQPQQGQQPPQGMNPEVGLLARELAGIKEFVRTLSTERETQERQAINGAVQQFSQDKLYFEDVRKDMADLIRTGKANTLDEAYDKACWMNPQIRDLLIKEQAAPQNAADRVSQARRASGSLRTGAPAGNAPSGSSTSNLRSALLDAWDSSSV